MLALDAEPEVAGAGPDRDDHGSRGHASRCRPRTARSPATPPPSYPASTVDRRSRSSAAPATPRSADGGSVTIDAPRARPLAGHPGDRPAPGQRSRHDRTARGHTRLGSVDSGDIGAQGDSPAPGALLPVTLPKVAQARSDHADRDHVHRRRRPGRLDAVMLQPLVSRLVLRGRRTHHRAAAQRVGPRRAAAARARQRSRRRSRRTTAVAGSSSAGRPRRPGSPVAVPPEGSSWSVADPRPRHVHAPNEEP